MAQEALYACVRLQRANVQWLAGLRTGILIFLALLVGLALDRLAASLSVAIGILFVSIADGTDSRTVRLRSMLWATLWISAAVLLGGIVSELAALHVLAAIAMALLCGYAGSLGARGALIGVLALVLFAFYAGASVVIDIAALDAIYFVAGGLIAIVVNLLTSPPRRLGAVRSGIAHAYRELQDAASRRGLALAAPAVATAVMSARTIADHEGCAGATAAWVDRLLADAERARLALLALLSERDIDPAYVDALTAQLSRTSRAIADEISVPVGLRVARHRTRTRQQVDALQALTAQPCDPRLAPLASDIADALASAADALDASWPIGTKADLARPSVQHIPITSRLRAHLHMSDPVTEHAIRLAVAFGGATLATVLIAVLHAYWLPLTVAWIAKPDLANTVSRVTMRIFGTIAGLVAVAAILAVTDAVPGQAILLCVAVGTTGALSLAYLSANYPIAVLGVTGFVLLIEHLAGDGEEYDIVARLIATTLAGLWVLLIASIRPRRTGSAAAARMSATIDALRDYARLVRDGLDTSSARTRVLTERTAALAAVSAATLETPGIWERSGDRIDPVQAEAVMTDVIEVASSILAEELLAQHGESDPEVWIRIDADLDDLSSRIEHVRIDPDRGST